VPSSPGRGAAAARSGAISRKIVERTGATSRVAGTG
jgi:hypothetical protein